MLAVDLAVETWATATPLAMRDSTTRPRADDSQVELPTVAHRSTTRWRRESEALVLEMEMTTRQPCLETAQAQLEVHVRSNFQLYSVDSSRIYYGGQEL